MRTRAWTGLHLWVRQIAAACALTLAAVPGARAQSLQPGGPVDFGTVAVGATPQTFIMSFSVTTTTTIQSVQALTDGIAGKDFSIVSNTCVGTLVSPQACGVTIGFSPTAPGFRRGVLQLTDASGSIVNTVYLHGIGSGPQMLVAPSAASSLTVSGVSPATYRASAVVADAEGSLYFNDVQNGRILKRTSAGVVTNVGTLGTTATTSMAIDGAGVLYLSSGATVYKLLPGGTPTAISMGSMTLSSPSGVAVDGQGYLYVADSALNTILRIGPDGTSTVLTLTGLSTPLSSPEGLTTDDTYLYIADAGNNRVVRAGLYSGAATSVALPVTAPRDVSVDAAGDLSVTDVGNARVVLLPASGSAVALSWTGTALQRPLGLAMLAGGDLAVADEGAGLVQVARSAGALTFPTATRLGALDAADGSLTASLLNSGNLALTMTLPASGTNPALSSSAFAASASGSCPLESATSTTAATIAVGSLCSYAVSFTPTMAGINSGTLVLTAAAASTGSTATVLKPTVTLQGTGIAAATKLTLVATPSVTSPGSPVQLTVSATDAAGDVQTDYTGTVTLSTTDSTATLNPASYTFTASDKGTHTFASGVTFHTNGLYTVSGTDGTLSGVSNQVRVTSVTGFSITATPSQTGVGSPVSFTVTAVDNGVVVPSYTGTVTFATNDATAKFLSGTTYTFTAADLGTHTFAAASGVSFNQTGSFQITGTDGTFTGTSNTVQVYNANGFTLVASPDTVELGGAAGLTVSATYNGVVVPGYTGTATFSATDPAAKFLGGNSYTFAATDAGTHTFSVSQGVQFNTLGTYTVAATDGTLTGTSNSVHVVAVDSFVVTATPSETTVGVPVAYTVTAMYKGSVATNFTGTVSFTSSDSTAKFLSGTSYTFTSADAGTHEFVQAQGVSFNATGTFTITATVGDVSGESNPVTVTGPQGFTVVATPSLVMPGTPVSYTISATQNGAVVSNYTGTVTIATTDTSAKFLSGTSYTFTAADQGTHTFSSSQGVVFNTVGSYALAVTDGTLKGTSNTVQVALPNDIALLAAPATTSVGVPVALTLSATYNGKTVAGYTGTISLTSTDSTVKFLSGNSYTFTVSDAGTHTFAAGEGVQFNQVGSFTVSGSDGTRSGTSNAVEVTGATAFTVVASPSSTTVGQPVSFTVTAVQNGVAYSGFTGTVSFASTDATAKFLSGTAYTFTAADNGTHTFTAAAGVQFNAKGTFTVTATAGTLSGVSNSVVVTDSASATAFSVIATPATVHVGSPVSVTVSAVKAAGDVDATFTGSVAFSSTDSAARFLAGTSYTFTAADEGTHTFAAPANGVVMNTVGTQTITVTNGTLSGVSNSIVVTAGTVVPSVTLSSSSNPTVAGSSLALTAVVAGSGAGTLPTGYVTFEDAGTVLGTAVLANGTATIRGVAFTSVGTHSLTAVYNGDSIFTSATSPAYEELVQDFALSLAANSSSALSIYNGHTASYSLMVTPEGGASFAAAVSFTVSGAPQGAKVVITPSSVAAGASATGFTVAITPPVTTSSLRVREERRWAPLTLALLLLPAAGCMRRRRIASMLMLALLLLPLTAMTGCLSNSSDGYYGNTPHTYNLVVTGASGTMVHSVTLTLTTQ
ncbi:MAG: Ig-like domain repeat protein [Acidobacteriaceae bacterium]|nr:Ig-like domain repeat protein [Acidobacteriaceae bacterium]